jgi:hypothetical protein
MTKHFLTYGLISGTLISAFMLYSMHQLSHCNGNIDFNNSMLIGYASMLIAFSMVFIGIRNYRDKYNGGSISFGESFKIGLMIVLIASTMYVIAWQIDYFFFIPDFMDNYSANAITQLKESGASQAEIDKQANDMKDFIQKYQNPAFNAMITYMEILPVGLIVTLLSSFILKRKTAVA